jgi:hypothetical protein
MRTPDAVSPKRIAEPSSAQKSDDNRRSTSRVSFPLIPWNEIRLSTAPSCLVQGLIPQTGLVVIYGAPKCGKTFWVLDLMMHVALGWPYRGRHVQQGPVVYCLFEGLAGFSARAEAFRRVHLAKRDEAVPFYLMPTKLALVKQHRALIDSIRQQCPDRVPSAVVIDTLNRSFTGSESNDTDMTAYVSACDAIREAFDCATLVVHHSGLEAGRPRGHTALLGAADAQIAVKKQGKDQVVVALEFMKDGPADVELTSRLETVDLGEDDLGEPMSSCVIMPTDENCSDRPELRLSRNQEAMLNILRDAGDTGLTVDQWNARTRQSGLGAKRSATLYETRMALKEKKLVSEAGERWYAICSTP